MGGLPVIFRHKVTVRGLGDVVHIVAQPIVKAIDTVAGTKIYECGGCKRRREALNKAVPLTRAKLT